jgi:hypothetical protein
MGEIRYVTATLDASEGHRGLLKKHQRRSSRSYQQVSAIIGGGSDYPHVLPANGQVKVSARLLVPGTPDHCEMTAQPWDL